MKSPSVFGRKYIKKKKINEEWEEHLKNISSCSSSIRSEASSTVSSTVTEQKRKNIFYVTSKAGGREIVVADQYEVVDKNPIYMSVKFYKNIDKFRKVFVKYITGVTSIEAGVAAA